jgi:predicted TPR repeat methyltransferase
MKRKDDSGKGASKQRKRAFITTLAPDEAVARAIALQQSGQDEAAVRLYRSVLARFPEHVDALHFMGIAEHRAGRSTAALALLDRAVQHAPEHADLHNNRGNVCKQLGKFDEAYAAYNRALELEPEHFSALSNLGTIARERGELEHAVELFQEALALQPKHYESQLNLGITWRRLGRLGEAIGAFEQALRLRPNDETASLRLGTTYSATGQVERAISVYRQWLESDPQHPVARHLLAGCTGQGVPARASDAFVCTSFDSFASHFDSSLQRLEYRAPALVAAAVEAALGELVTPLEVLDAGCGTGLCGPHLRPRAGRLVGVDLSPGMLARAQARGGYDELIAAELTAYLAQQSARFELIACADTLVYFGGLETVLGGFARALRPKGHAVFTLERSEPEQAPDGFRIHPHGRYSHTEQYVRAVLAQLGMSLTALDTANLRREAGNWVRGWVVTATK